MCRIFSPYCATFSTIRSCIYWIKAYSTLICPNSNYGGVYALIPGVYHGYFLPGSAHMYENQRNCCVSFFLFAFAIAFVLHFTNTIGTLFRVSNISFGAFNG